MIDKECSNIVVSSGSPEYMAGIVIETGNTVRIPTIAQIPDLLDEIDRLERANKVRCVTATETYCILVPMAKLTPIGQFIVGFLPRCIAVLSPESKPCESCGSIMIPSGNQLKCISCGKYKS